MATDRTPIPGIMGSSHETAPRPLGPLAMPDSPIYRPITREPRSAHPGTRSGPPACIAPSDPDSHARPAQPGQYMLASNVKMGIMANMLDLSDLRNIGNTGITGNIGSMCKIGIAGNFGRLGKIGRMGKTG